MKGFADTHCHQFANLAFGGRVVWGDAYGAIDRALPPCDPIHGKWGQGDALANVLRTFSYGANPLGLIGHTGFGDPTYSGWPRWDSITHQHVHHDMLKRAVDGGLRLMVMLAVNNRILAEMAAERSEPTEDMDTVRKQLEAARNFERLVDHESGGPARGWYRIVHTPAEAREVIEQGKLAVVLGIEVDFIFNSPSADPPSQTALEASIREMYDLGVRHVFPVHFSDNAFGGTAFQNGLIWSRNEPEANDRSAKAVHALAGEFQFQCETEENWDYDYREHRRNKRGLTELGRTLINRLVSYGFIIDVDHMSYRTRSAVLDICEARRSPVVSGHTGFIDLCRGDKKHEGQLKRDELERILRLGGMVSVITNQGGLKDMIPAYREFSHACGHSSRSLAMALQYAVDVAGDHDDRPVGIGTDLNGFAGQPAPRHGAEACAGDHLPAPAYRPKGRLPYPFTSVSGVALGRSQVGQRTYDFNTDGLAHVGLLPDLVEDLRWLVPDAVASLERSAEGYLDVWERVESGRARSSQAAVSLLSWDLPPVLAVPRSQPPAPEVPGRPDGARIPTEPSSVILLLQ